MEALKTIVGSVFGESKCAAPSVTDVFIYPVKSCGACRVGNAAVIPHGFHRDRIFQVVKQVDGAWHYCTPTQHVDPTRGIQRRGKLESGPIFRHADALPPRVRLIL
jgi:hypothetical protein